MISMQELRVRLHGLRFLYQVLRTPGIVRKEGVGVVEAARYTWKMRALAFQRA